MFKEENMKDLNARDFVNIIATVFVPPLGVALKEGIGVHFCLNVVLTIFGMYVAGLVHGLYVVLRR